MGVYIYFKGVPDPIQATIVYSSKDVTTSFDDLVPKDTRNVLEINFPETVDFDTLLNVYRNEDALSEITIKSDSDDSVFVHFDYVIRQALSLQAYSDKSDKEALGVNRWVMRLAQLTEADKQFRQIVGVAAKATSYMTLDEYKEAQIQISKENLDKFLRKHPLISACKDGIFAPYTATTDKQTLFVSQFASYSANKQAGIEDQMTWNEAGKSCIPWTDQECLLFMNDMKRYTKPLVAAQQHYEESILSLTTKVEVEAAMIDYATVATYNGDPSWIGHTVSEVEEMMSKNN